MTPTLTSLIKRTNAYLIGYEYFPEKNKYPVYLVKLTVKRTSVTLNLNPHLIALKINRENNTVKCYILEKKDKDVIDHWKRVTNLLSDEEIKEYINRILLTVENKLLPEKPIGNGIGKFIFAA